jgi:hypothetical protein
VIRSQPAPSWQEWPQSDAWAFMGGVRCELHAASFIWDGSAESERDAIDKARRALRCEGLDETARVAICLERKG